MHSGRTEVLASLRLRQLVYLARATRDRWLSLVMCGKKTSRNVTECLQEGLGEVMTLNEKQEVVSVKPVVTVRGTGRY